MIPPRIHGIIDYVVALLLILAPFVLGFADGSAAQWVPIWTGVAIIGVSLLTRYELSALKLIPYPVHLALDVAVGLFLLTSPWLFGFADRIWWPHVTVGVLSFIVVALSLGAARR
jgi:hypothetical protein